MMNELKIGLIENSADVESAKSRLAEIDAERQALQDIVDAERGAKRTQVIDSVRETIKAYGLTASDLGFVGKASLKQRTVSDKRNVVAPKYQDPYSGKTWTGRGKSPAWLNAQLAAGREKQEFLIQR